MQREEFKRLGVEGDWDHSYSTMDYRAEATIAAELMKFAMNGALYRGSKPVMWSVVEKTALAEAEVEYHDYTSDTVWVKFPVNRASRPGPLALDSASMWQSEDCNSTQYCDASVVIWTTTPGRSPATGRSASLRRSSTASTR